MKSIKDVYLYKLISYIMIFVHQYYEINHNPIKKYASIYSFLGFIASTLYIIYLLIFYMFGNGYYYYLDPFSYISYGNVKQIHIRRVFGKLPEHYNLIYFYKTLSGDSLSRKVVVLKFRNNNEGIGFINSIFNNNYIKYNTIDHIQSNIGLHTLPEFIIEECQNADLYFFVTKNNGQVYIYGSSPKSVGELEK